MDRAALETFVAVADLGGFRPAARALYMSQPTVSRTIHRLEEELGVPLFHRGPGGTRLTRHGEALLAGSRRALEGLEQLRAQAIAGGAPQLRLGTAAGVAASLVAPFLSSWLRSHEQLDIKLLHHNAVDVRSRLEAGECDAAIIAMSDSDQFAHLPVSTIGLQACMSVDHPMAGTRGPISVNELHRQSVLVNGSPYLSTELFRNACRAAAVELDVVYECDAPQTLAALAEAGLGIAVVNDIVDLRAFELVSRKVVDHHGEPINYELRIAWARNDNLSPAAHDFIRKFSKFSMSRSPHTAPRSAAASVD